MKLPLSISRVTLLFSLIILIPLTQLGAQNKPLNVGDSVPHFSLKDQNDSLFNIDNYIGKKVLVFYFYHGEESSGPTSFGYKTVDFKNHNAIVIAINTGTPESHKKFAEKNKLTYTILSDPDKKVMNMFGLKGGLFSGQATFVVDLSGQVVFYVLKGSDHASKAIDYVRHIRD